MHSLHTQPAFNTIAATGNQQRSWLSSIGHQTLLITPLGKAPQLLCNQFATHAIATITACNCYIQPRVMSVVFKSLLMNAMQQPACLHRHLVNEAVKCWLSTALEGYVPCGVLC